MKYLCVWKNCIFGSKCTLGRLMYSNAIILPVGRILYFSAVRVELLMKEPRIPKPLLYGELAEWIQAKIEVTQRRRPSSFQNERGKPRLCKTDFEQNRVAHEKLRRDTANGFDVYIPGNFAAELDLKSNECEDRHQKSSKPSLAEKTFINIWCDIFINDASINFYLFFYMWLCRLYLRIESSRYPRVFKWNLI